MLQCPLCLSIEEQKFEEKNFQVLKHQNIVEWQHFHCGVCDLIFIDPAAHLPQVEERKRYEQHQNLAHNAGYVKYLRPALDLILAAFPMPHGRPRSEISVLDFGCGPGPVLADLLRQHGFDVHLFDPYFFAFPQVLQRTYELIVSTEVFEHFYNPSFEIERLRNCLDDKNGILLVQTGLHQGDEFFKQWWYARDPSHVVFYSKKTFEWIQNKWQFPKLLLVE
jgi:2-polyprenyl-3-methyl-5-hydroxy-6-metoxy-1,4-benzoquinol methylase